MRKFLNVGYVISVLPVGLLASIAFFRAIESKAALDWCTVVLHIIQLVGIGVMGFALLQAHNTTQITARADKARVRQVLTNLLRKDVFRQQSAFAGVQSATRATYDLILVSLNDDQLAQKLVGELEETVERIESLCAMTEGPPEGTNLS